MPIYPVLLADGRVITVSPAPGLTPQEVDEKIADLIGAAFPGARRLPAMEALPLELVGLPEDAWRWSDEAQRIEIAWEISEIWDELRQERAVCLAEADWRMERARDRERMALHAEEQQAARDEQIELAAYREAWRKLPGSCKDPRQCEPPPRPWRGEVKEDLFDPRLR